MNCKTIIVCFFLVISNIYSQYDYSLENLNPNSESFGENIGVSYYSDHITLHYFGHFT